MGIGVLSRLFKRSPLRHAAEQLHDAVVVQARDPAFFTRFKVPDNLDGRFEMLTLHAFLVADRLRGEGEVAQGLSQALFDRMFAVLDNTVREMGAGDLGVGKRVRKMAQAFFGRSAVYAWGLDPERVPGPRELKALDPDARQPDLEGALARNVFGAAVDDAPQARDLATYVRAQRAALQAQPVAELMAGRVRFEPVAALLPG